MTAGDTLNALIRSVEVMRGRHGEELLVGPLPGAQYESVVAYEFELPHSFEPWPGRTLLERTFVLLDFGVSLANPCWARQLKPDGTVVDRGLEGRDTWYVDLVSVEQDGNRFTLRDLYVDVMVPMDGRHYRMLDLDEFADAIDDGSLSVEQATDALRRWQRFLDRHLHAERAPVGAWTTSRRPRSCPYSNCGHSTIGAVQRFRRRHDEQAEADGSAPSGGRPPARQL